MKKYIGTSLFIFTLLFTMIGCGTAQIKNVPSQAISIDKTDNDVYKAIHRAGNSLGWIVTQVDANTALATLNLRSHQAVVTIKYTTKDYSITYKSSVNLNYNEEQNHIHSNYNGWITNFDNAIKLQLNTI